MAQGEHLSKETGMAASPSSANSRAGANLIQPKSIFIALLCVHMCVRANFFHILHALADRQRDRLVDNTLFPLCEYAIK